MLAEDELKRLIFEYLSQNRLMTLATSQNNIPWASTVFFAYDQELHIYFLTEPDTRKLQHILKNSKVSAAINQVWQSGRGKIKGLQLEGEAQVTESKKEIKIFSDRFFWAKDFLKKGSKIVKIRPKKIIYLDDQKFGPQGREELLLEN